MIQQLGRFIYKPTPHHCDPGWTRYEITDSTIGIPNGSIGLAPPETGIPAGSIWQCDECGKTWVAHYPRANWLSPSFRPEGRLERRRRERRTDTKESP